MSGGIFFAVCTGVSWAIISVVMSNVARFRVPEFLFYAVGASFTALFGWLFLVNWDMVMAVPVKTIISAVPYFLLPGAINVASQTMMVKTFKLGHNGISLAIRNCAGIVPFTVGFFFLGSAVSWLNFGGLVLILSGITLIAVKKQASEAAAERGFSILWLLAAITSMLLSGTFQTLNTLLAVKLEFMVKSGLATPLLMSCCACGYGAVYFFWQRKHVKGSILSPQVWKYAFMWGIMALAAYFFMFRTLAEMNRFGSTALVFPIVAGVNVSCFSVYSKLKLRESYTLKNLGALVMCLLGVILLSWH